MPGPPAGVTPRPPERTVHVPTDCSQRQQAPSPDESKESVP